eukprot:11733899-Alexandrium_andersonii.AAC.1
MCIRDRYWGLPPLPPPMPPMLYEVPPVPPVPWAIAAAASAAGSYDGGFESAAWAAPAAESYD